MQDDKTAQSLAAQDPPDAEGGLRLFAFDELDLAIVSASMQEAIISPSQMLFQKNQQRFVLAGDRLDWDLAHTGTYERVTTGLHFETVQKVERSGFEQGLDAKDLTLLSIHFHAEQAPGGYVILVFSGGAALRLHVACLEASLRDLGPRRKVDKPADANPL
ncbi:MAG: DUF2948 family protein [Hyphomicrobiales bacterium]|nr:DUF2948 family protein [Hyphomicrobiales bacterium]MDE2115743.1 DUF2948 family protein [Hyphomicrobiales bacterium]